MRHLYIFRSGGRERPLKYVPGLVYLLLPLLVISQVVINDRLPARQAVAQSLPRAAHPDMLDLAAFGDHTALSKYLMLWLQAFDNQPGVSIPFGQLDYDRLRDWLQVILGLDPHAHYPLLSASRIYTEVPDPEKKRIMLDFVEEQFMRQPRQRWPWMAHAVYVAKHQLQDLDLALKLARKIREHVPSGEAPAWARQMEIYVLEDMDQIESAMVLIGGLLESGQIRDENELHYLKYKLEKLKNSK